MVAARVNRTPLTPFGLACCGVYGAYGVRLAQFILRRNREESYAPKFQEIQLKSDFMGPAGELFWNCL